MTKRVAGVLHFALTFTLKMAHVVLVKLLRLNLRCHRKTRICCFCRRGRCGRTPTAVAVASICPELPRAFFSKLVCRQHLLALVLYLGNHVLAVFFCPPDDVACNSLGSLDNKARALDLRLQIDAVTGTVRLHDHLTAVKRGCVDVHDGI